MGPLVGIALAVSGVFEGRALPSARSVAATVENALTDAAVTAPDEAAMRIFYYNNMRYFTSPTLLMLRQVLIVSLFVAAGRLLARPHGTG